MTEAEWLAATDPTPMLMFLRGKPGDRKLRLFACACCRSVWHLQSEQAQNGMNEAEKFADGFASEGTLRVAHGLARNVFDAADFMVISAIEERMPAEDVEHAQRERLAAKLTLLATEDDLQGAFRFGQRRNPDNFIWEDDKLQEIIPTILRDIFGNPFCPVAVAPTWLTSDVLALATGIYEDRAFDRMPILADALTDAGCNSEAVLNHCRSESVHLRGCWVVDLLLGKA